MGDLPGGPSKSAPLPLTATDMRKAGTSPGLFPPPTNMMGRGAPRKTGSVTLPKFSDITGEDDGVPQAPPRSPRLTITLADLPTIPPRASVTVNASQAEVAAPGGKKRTQAELRKECITEIYQTEKDYIDDLETMISVFIFPMRTMEVLNEQALYAIFSNLEVLINCNKEMLKELEQVMSTQSVEGGDVHLGDVFTKLADYFKMYKVFCANQQNSLTSVDQQTKKNPQFKKNLDICHTDPRCKGLFLQSFLIKPIQRVCKYPLLLRELIRYTPEDHADFQPLQNAFNKINEVVANINEGQRQAEGLQRIIELQRQIEGIDTLVAPNRNLQKEGDLSFYKSAKTKNPEKRHVFFLSDLIILTVRKGEKKFEHKLSIPLENCTLTVLADSSYIKNSFELVQGEKKHKVKCILGCDTAKESHEWVKNIKGLIKEYQKRKFSELKKMQEQGLTPIAQ